MITSDLLRLKKEVRQKLLDDLTEQVDATLDDQESFAGLCSLARSDQPTSRESTIETMLETLSDYMFGYWMGGPLKAYRES